MGRVLPLLLLLASPAVAHVLPKAEFTRRIDVRLDPAGVTVEYAVVLAEDTMILDGSAFQTPADREALGLSVTREAFFRWYLSAKGERMAKSFFARLDATDVTFHLVTADGSQDDHNKKLRFVFRADWPTATAAARAFEFTDETTYVKADGKSTSDDAAGAVKLTVTAKAAGEFAEFDADDPPERLHKLRSELKPDEEPRRRRGSATFRLPVDHRLLAGRGAVIGVAALFAHLAPAPAEPPQVGVTRVEPPKVEVTPDDRGAVERGLKGLLDSNLGIVLLLLLAVVFGAAHAFTPGHGKTMVAAYLVGERGTVWHAVVLGITATAAHTGSVILVAVVLYFSFGNFAPDWAQAWLMLAGGLFIFGVGVWLLMQRLRGKADHVHLFGADHTHAPDGSTQYHAPKEKPKTNFGWVRVVLLGLGGGIIPCWDAVMMLLLAMAQGQIGLAIPLLFAFSVGLAAVLVLLGVAVLAAHRLGGKKFGDARWFRYLPAVSAAVLVVVGLWFLRDGLEALRVAGQ